MWENSQGSSKPHNCENKTSERFLVLSPNWDFLMIHFFFSFFLFFFSLNKKERFTNERENKLLAYILQRVVKNARGKILLYLLVAGIFLRKLNLKKNPLWNHKNNEEKKSGQTACFEKFIWTTN